jgi:diamine N-acetyltransferase
VTDIDNRQKVVVETLLARVERNEELGNLRHCQGTLNRQQFRELWLDLLNRMRRTYSATNYIAAEEIYSTDWAKAALLIQNGKKTAFGGNMVIKKVFLIDDDSEMAVVGKYLDEQRRIGIDIHFLPYKEIHRDPDLSSRFKSGDISSIDFGIVDDDTVLVWNLNLKGRTLVDGCLLMGQDNVVKHREFFDLLFQKAAAYDRNRLVLIPILDGETKDIINRWPKYGAPYEEMDYALRSPNGWLYTFGSKPSAKSYAAYYAGCLVGFSILVLDGKGSAEFYVAIHPEDVGKTAGTDKTEKGFGTKVTKETMRHGFEELRLKTIELKVRPDLKYRIDMYEKVGFKRTGHKTEMIDGKSTEFNTMAMQTDDWQRK